MSNFDDVGEFHKKFELPNMNDGSACAGRIDHLTNQALEELLEFRTRFMSEELHEFAVCASDFDHEGMFDALLDLVYVAMGTAQLLGYPWQEGWEEVQRANMTKSRCTIDHRFTQLNGLNKCIECGQPKEAHSSRGSNLDVIKPAGWTGPDIKAVLKAHGFSLEEK